MESLESAQRFQPEPNLMNIEHQYGSTRGKKEKCAISHFLFGLATKSNAMKMFKKNIGQNIEYQEQAKQTKFAACSDEDDEKDC